MTDSLAEYEALALALAQDEVRLGHVRAKLRRNRQSFPLFDTERFRRHIESAYVTMADRLRRGEPPHGSAVSPVDG